MVPAARLELLRFRDNTSVTYTIDNHLTNVNKSIKKTDNPSRRYKCLKYFFLKKYS